MNTLEDLRGAETRWPMPFTSLVQRCLMPLGLLCLVSFAPLRFAEATLIPLSPQAGVSLPAAIGEDLWTEGSGLPPNIAVDLRLISDGGVIVAEHPTRTDSHGQLAGTRLWTTTGVVGCAISPLPGAFRFQTFAVAEQTLINRTFQIQIVSPGAGALLASRPVLWQAPSQPIFYFSDATGCLVSRLCGNEDLYLSSYGPANAPLFAFLVVDRPRWALNGPPFWEVRGFPKGESLPTGALFSGPRLVAAGGQLAPGFYALILRPQSPGGGNRSPDLGGGDIVLGTGPQEPGGSTEDGLIIEDWGDCGGAALP